MKKTYSHATSFADNPELEAVAWYYQGAAQVMFHQRAMQLIQQNNILALAKVREGTSEINAPELWGDDAVSPDFLKEYAIGTSRVFAAYVVGLRVDGEVVDGMSYQNSGIDRYIAWLEKNTAEPCPEIHPVLQELLRLSLTTKMLLVSELMANQLLTRRCLLAASSADCLGSVQPESTGKGEIPGGEAMPIALGSQEELQLPS